MTNFEEFAQGLLWYFSAVGVALLVWIIAFVVRFPSGYGYPFQPPKDKEDDDDR